MKIITEEPNRTSKNTGFDYNKPLLKNTAHLLNPQLSTVDAEANQLWNTVMSAKCAYPDVKGNVWYISNNGDDSNDGRTPTTAIATFKTLETKCQPASGDAILFECGSVWHDTFPIVLTNDMFLGSYGSGDKPAIYGSAMNYATAVWMPNVEGKIWRLESLITTNVGNIICNHGERVGLKKISMEALEAELDFFFDGSYVYMYSNENPSALFKSIEIGTNRHIILTSANASDIIIDNLTLKYSGAMGIQVLDNSKNIIIRNCEIGWIGGSDLKENTPYGNGIEFWNGCEDVLVENNWIYQVFDAGISHQGNSKHVAKNVVFKNNLIEYCDYAAIEYWHHPATQNEMINITYTKNIMRFSGFGWGSFRREGGVPHIRSNSGMDNKATNFVISDNIMEYSSGSLVYSLSNVNTLPTLAGNRYIQAADRSLCMYGCPSIITDNVEHAEKVIKEIMKDETGVFELYSNPV